MSDWNVESDWTWILVADAGNDPNPDSPPKHEVSKWTWPDREQAAELALLAANERNESPILAEIERDWLVEDEHGNLAFRSDDLNFSILVFRADAEAAC